MKLKELLLGSIAAIALTGTASAAYVSPTGWYLSLGAGANWIEDGHLNWVTSGVASDGADYHYDSGYIVSGAVGWDYGQHWRVEFEVAYRDNDADETCYSGACYDSSAQIWELSQMVNVYYDHQIAENWEVSVGAGVGGNLVVLEAIPNHSDFDDYVLAGQLMAQVAYQISDRWKAFADYRYMVMDDPDFLDIDHPQNRFQIEKAEHAIQIGLRFDLQRDGAAPPHHDHGVDAPKQFIVFFGFNKSNLTAEAARVVADAAAAAKKYGSASISVVGHTDTVGSNDYNMRLSMRRSQAVKDGLIANGIAGTQISTGGRGEAELMIQTGDGVKEPQNRRATIDLNN